MAADCHHRQRNKQPEQCEREVEPAIWTACAGKTVHIPAIGSRVYYFPQGHMEHSPDPQSVLSSVAHLPPRPFLICRVLQVLYLVDSDSDEVFARIRLEPRDEGRFLARRPEGERSSEEVVSFAKVLTPSDANNGGGFSVPRFCADSIFPPLDYAADPPVQTLSITDLRGQTWNFRHIYRGTPRRHLLTTGWSKYVNSKKLIAGDSVVFMKSKVKDKEELFLGVRRAKKSVSSAEVTRWLMTYGSMTGSGKEAGEGRLPRKKKEKVSPESVAEALELAANNMPFEAVYYPKAGSRDFVVDADKVDAAMAIYWTAGTRVKMAVETEDSSRMTWFEGTVSCVLLPDYATWQRSPWSMLQVAWDEPDVVLEKMNKVSPWQVERVSQMPPNDAAFPPAKKPRLPTEGEADYPLPHLGFSNSMIEDHLRSSYSNYSIIPAGMQGARQDTYNVPNLANAASGTRQLLPTGHADNNLHQKMVVMSTDLNIGSSQSDVSPEPHSASSILSSRPDVTGLLSRTSAPNIDKTKIMLFGSTISRQEVANKENQELGNPQNDGRRT